MSGFTPGPWKCREIDPRDPKWGAHEVSPAKGGRHVSTMVCGAGNAHLISAAPELYEVLKSLIEYYDSDQAISAESVMSYISMLDAARAALAKATGGQP